MTYKCDYCGGKIHYLGQHTTYRYCARHLKTENGQLREVCSKLLAEIDLMGDDSFAYDFIDDMLAPQIIKLRKILENIEEQS